MVQQYHEETPYKERRVTMTKGMRDTAFEMPRKQIAPEHAEQQCSCYYCAWDCNAECRVDGNGLFYNVDYRNSYQVSDLA
jgi:anaerobic selenocysteine-containing dehydrogenase